MKNPTSLFLCLLLMFFVIQARAQSDSTIVDITELSLSDLQNVKIVTANKTLMAADQVSATAYVITEEQIRIRGYRSLLDVLADVPDIKIDDKIYSLNRNIITLRGIDGQDKFLIMLDGVRVSSPTNETLPIMENYPVNLAKQIEIIMGPASALYGADAFAGIINIISKKGEFKSLRAEASLSAGTHGLTNGNLYLSKKLAKDISLTVSGQYFYDEGVDMSKQYKRDTLWDMTSHQTGVFNTIYGTMIPKTPVKNEYASPLMAYNFFTSLKAGEFEFSLFNNYVQNSSALENTPSNAVHNKDVFIGKSITAASAKHSKTINKITFITSFIANEYKEDPKSNYRNMFSGMEPAYKYAHGSMMQGEEQVEWKIKTGTNMVGGVLYQSFFSLPESADLQEPVDESHSIEGTLLNTPSYYQPNGISAKFYSVKYYNAGAYLQIQQSVLKKTHLTLGARFDHNSRFGSTFNPRVGMVSNLSKKSILKAMVGTAYLAPAPSTAYAYYGTFYTLDSGKTYSSNFFHLPNPDLKPMISKNAEISFRQYIGKNLSATLTGYMTIVQNIIEPEADDSNLYNGKFLGWNVDYIEIFGNEGTETIMGGSFQLDYKKNFGRGSIKAYSYLSYVNGTEKAEWIDQDGVRQSGSAELDNQMSHVMLKTGMDLQLSNFSISPRLIHMSRQHLGSFINPENPMSRQTIPGYTLVNLSVGYKIGKPTLFINVMNALNTKYKSVGIGMDLNNPSTGLFYGNDQDPIRINGGIRVAL